MTPASLSLHVLLTESRLAEELAAALAERRLPEKFFYWQPLSVRAWLDLCGQGPYRNFSRSHRLVRRFTETGFELPAPPADVWSLGPGNGEKDRMVLDHLRARGADPRYRAVDSSLGLLEVACAAAAHAGYAVDGFKADLEDAEHRARLRSLEPDRSRLVLVLGNTLGGLDPLEFAPALGGFLRSKDLVLVDGEIGAGEETLAGYDNPDNRRFAFAPLAAIGLTSEDGDLCFEYQEDRRSAGLTVVRKHFRARRDLTVSLGGRSQPLAAGEILRMSGSHKYTPEAFSAILADRAGLETIRLETTEDGRYLMALARPRAEHG